MRNPMQPGDSSSTKAFRICRWALARGGRFTPKELQAHFHLNKSTAYRYAKEWHEVMGDEPPPRARPLSPAQKRAELAALQAAVTTPGERSAQVAPTRISLGDLLRHRST